jgi:lipid-binding SYLF domain-containing protein
MLARRSGWRATLGKEDLMNLIRPAWTAGVLALAFLTPAAAHAVSGAGVTERVEHAREAYEQLVRTADRGVPDALLKRCKAIAVFPGVIKGAIGFGARYGKGVVIARSGGGWSPLAFFTLAGGSWGLQLGGESADIVLFFMTDRGVRSLLGSKFTLGGKAGLAAGPVGRTAEAGTDVTLSAEIYSYARSRGLFAGISLEGARMASDDKSNESFYGERLTARELLTEGKAPRRPPAAEKLIAVLP